MSHTHNTHDNASFSSVKIIQKCELFTHYHVWLHHIRSITQAILLLNAAFIHQNTLLKIIQKCELFTHYHVWLHHIRSKASQMTVIILNNYVILAQMCMKYHTHFIQIVCRCTRFTRIVQQFFFTRTQREESLLILNQAKLVE